MTHRVLVELQSIVDDPQASADERTAARELLMTLPYGARPGHTHMAVLHGYIERRQRQDRYGK